MSQEYFLEETDNGHWHVTDGEQSLEGNHIECITWIAKRIIDQKTKENPGYFNPRRCVSNQEGIGDE